MVNYAEQQRRRRRRMKVKKEKADTMLGFLSHRWSNRMIGTKQGWMDGIAAKRSLTMCPAFIVPTALFLE
jgi:hypothetical protein